LKPKEFIHQVFIMELGRIKDQYPYISFAIMATGIEFLGKCLDQSSEHWNVTGRSKINFEFAINNLEAFKKYRPFLDRFKMHDSLRNGFAHSFVPKYSIGLSSKDEAPHMLVYGKNYDRLNLRCEDLYEDFRLACLEVIGMPFPNRSDKMNRGLLSVPEPNMSAETEIELE